MNLRRLLSPGPQNLLSYCCGEVNAIRDEGGSDPPEHRAADGELPTRPGLEHHPDLHAGIDHRLDAK